MKLLKKLQASNSFWFLLFTSVIFFLLRLPSLFEPYWYGDEGIYEVIGFGLRHGRLLYSGIWDNKPPLLYLVYALVDGNQGPAKFLSLLAGIGALIAFFFLSKKLLKNLKTTFFTTGLFAFLFGIPLIEGNIANAENFMLPLGITAGLILFSLSEIKTWKEKENRWTFIAGILLSLSFLFKVVGIFDLAAFVAFLGIIFLEKINFQYIFSTIKKLLPLFLGFIIPVIICSGFFILAGNFGEFIRSTLFSNVSYVNYGNQFIIPQGFLIFKTLLLAGTILFFLWKKHLFSTSSLFIFLWLAFSIYNSLFSQRPYTHYALVMLPSFILLLGLFLESKKKKIFYGITLVIFIIFVFKSFSFYEKTLGYYQNFVQFITDGKSEKSYQAFFDQGTPRDYALAQYITTHRQSNQTLFVWSNSGQIYKLTNTLPPGRFIVAYWITQNLKETKNALEKNKPTYIIVAPNAGPMPLSLGHYKEKLIIENATIYEYTF